MHCEKCGVELPKDAEFCFNCGTKVEGGGKIQAEQEIVVRFSKTTLIVIVAALCVALLILLFALAGRSTTSNNTTSDTDKKSDQYQITLTGKYVVGEDEELPPGIYEITAVQGESTFAMEIITGDGEDDYDFLWEKRVTGYKLRSGYKVSIRDRGAVFTKTADINETPKETPSESNDSASTDSDDVDEPVVEEENDE